MQELLSDPILYRGIERLLITVGAIFCIYLGYKLFLFGADKGMGNLKSESAFFKITFSGTGPGLFFMAFGAIVLLTALFSGEAVVSSDKSNQEKVTAVDNYNTQTIPTEPITNHAEPESLKAKRAQEIARLKEERDEAIKRSMKSLGASKY